MAKLIPGPDHVLTVMEMMRRQIVSSRELRGAILDFKESAERSSRMLNWLTVALVVFTIAVAVLTWRVSN